MRVEYHPATVSELNEAVAHYNNQRSDLGASLRLEVYAAIDRIIDNPNLYPEMNGVRRILVRRFPYSVIYRLLTNNHIRVLVIRHHKRDPEYGAGRR